MKWLLLLAAGAALFWWLDKFASQGGGSPVTLPIASSGAPAGAVYVEDQTIAGITVHVYESPQGFYLIAPFAGATRTIGPLSNLDMTRLIQLQQSLGTGG